MHVVIIFKPLSSADTSIQRINRRLRDPIDDPRDIDYSQQRRLAFKVEHDKKSSDCPAEQETFRYIITSWTASSVWIFQVSLIAGHSVFLFHSVLLSFQLILPEVSRAPFRSLLLKRPVNPRYDPFEFSSSKLLYTFSYRKVLNCADLGSFWRAVARSVTALLVVPSSGLHLRHPSLLAF